MEKYKELVEKSKIEKLEVYKEFQRKCVSDLSKLKLPKNFRIDILDPESEDNAFNYNRGFFTTARIFYKNDIVGLVSPEFSQGAAGGMNMDDIFSQFGDIFGGGGGGFSGFGGSSRGRGLSNIKILSLHLQLYGIFNSFLESFNYINEINNVDRLSRNKVTDTLQESLNFLEELRITMNKKMNEFLN